jgi:hypothetical protein
VERAAAALFGLKRFPANMGGRLDFGPQRAGDPPIVGQVKSRRTFSLRALTDMAEEMEEEAARLGDGCTVGLVVVKLSARKPTPKLVVMTEGMWERLVLAGAGPVTGPARAGVDSTTVVEWLRERLCVLLPGHPSMTHYNMARWTS